MRPFQVGEKEGNETRRQQETGAGMACRLHYNMGLKTINV
jgi:hypothetical protein